MSKRGDMNCSSCGGRHEMCGPRKGDMGRGKKYVTHSDCSNDKPPQKPAKSRWWK